MVSTCLALYIALSFTRLKFIFARDICDFGARTSSEELLVGRGLTGVSMVIASNSNVLYRTPPPISSDSTLRVEKTRLISVRIRTVGLHTGSEFLSHTGCPIS